MVVKSFLLHLKADFQDWNSKVDDVKGKWGISLLLSDEDCD
jgi:hypothetical protein